MLTHLSGVVHLHVNSTLNLSSHQWNQKWSSIYLGIGTVFCRLMARMGMNWNLKQLGQLFQVLMLYLQKSPPPPLLKKKFSFNAPWWNLFETLFTIIQQHFSYRGYYTVPRRYEFYFRVAKTIFYSLAHEFYFRVTKQWFYERAQRVSKILFLPRENKIHIFKPPCNVLFIE